MPDETKKTLAKSQISKISLNHSEHKMLIQINSDVLYAINEIDDLSEWYKSRLGFDYDVQISYIDEFDEIEREMIVSNILYLLKKHHNSLAKEIDEECVNLTENSQVSITVKNRILYEKIILNKTDQKISQAFQSLYRYDIYLTLDLNEQVSHMDLSKELEKIVRETSISNTPVQKKATTRKK
ncbi:MAG: hypothetical protein Q8S24_00860, partial [Eubacteriales bacterium]|nr:hypothetical protein [Eubacteriales bacterium]